jgi:Type I phosphodiesterase / nucleotide pyrophosphatase
MAGHVLVIGVDGTRFDALGAEATPSIWGLDVLTPITIDEATPSWSGPCWSNIATGVPVALHGITGNDFTGHRLAEHPDFLTVATRAGFGTLLAVAGWPPLATTEDGGPLFAEVSRREFVEASERHGMAAWDVADETVTAQAVSIIEADGPHASFVYLGAVDIAGHLIGAGADYHAAVRAADQRVGRLVAAVAARPDAADWTIVVVTDHGHLDEGGHGGREPEVITAWAGISGPGASGPAVASHLDIAPLVRHCLSLSQNGLWFPSPPMLMPPGNPARLPGGIQAGHVGHRHAQQLDQCYRAAFLEWCLLAGRRPVGDDKRRWRAPEHVRRRARGARETDGPGGGQWQERPSASGEIHPRKHARYSGQPAGRMTGPAEIMQARDQDFCQQSGIFACGVEVWVEDGDLSAGRPRGKHTEQVGQLRRVQSARGGAVNRRHEGRVEDVHVQMQPVAVQFVAVHDGQQRVRGGLRPGLADAAGRDDRVDERADLGQPLVVIAAAGMDRVAGQEVRSGAIHVGDGRPVHAYRRREVLTGQAEAPVAVPRVPEIGVAVQVHQAVPAPPAEREPGPDEQAAVPAEHQRSVSRV